MNPRVLFVMGEWPNPSETFLRREMAALAKLGLNFEILATKRNRGAQLNTQEAEWFSERTLFIPAMFSPEAVAGEAIALSTGPLLHAELVGQLTEERGFASTIPLRLPGVVWASRKVSGRGFTRVHAQFASMPAALGYALARWTELPFSFSCHARDIYTARAGFERLVNEAQFVVTCTEFNRKHLVQTFPSAEPKIHRVYHGVEIPQTPVTKARAEVPLLLAVGRLVEKKGFANLVSACKILGRRGVKYRCEILGDGPLRGDIEGFINALGPVEVAVRGWCSEDEVKTKMREAACLVAPSVIARDGDRDGIPNVVLEAMATGTPVVAGAVSGMPEAVVDGRTGLLVDAEDATVLAGAIGRVLADPELGRKLASEALTLVREKFDPETNAKQLMELLSRNG